jgi:hypothetical protein
MTLSTLRIVARNVSLGAKSFEVIRQLIENK